jgi:hypothetical protein
MIEQGYRCDGVGAELRSPNGSVITRATLGHARRPAHTEIAVQPPAEHPPACIPVGTVTHRQASVAERKTHKKSYALSTRPAGRVCST